MGLETLHIFNTLFDHVEKNKISFREVSAALNKESNEQITMRKARFVSNKKTVENEYQLLKECLFRILWSVE